MTGKRRSKLPVISARQCIRAFQKAGFFVARQSGSHITMRRENPKNQIVIPNHKIIKPGTLRTIIRNADMTIEEFNDLL
jgi:predicted RNA binding protein YcfA (HicA-like mRNA interferase family)